MKNQQLQVGLEVALMAVVAYVLGLLPLGIAFFEIEIGMVPIVLLSLRRGSVAGIMSGFLWGLIKLLTGNVWILSPFQVFLEYFIAFAASGMAGLFANRVKKYIQASEKKSYYNNLALASIWASFWKYLIHFIAGLIFWSSYAPEGMGAVIYSLLVNGSAFIMTGTVNSLILIFLARTNKSLFIP